MAHIPLVCLCIPNPHTPLVFVWTPPFSLQLMSSKGRVGADMFAEEVTNVTICLARRKQLSHRWDWQWPASSLSRSTLATSPHLTSRPSVILVLCVHMLRSAFVQDWSLFYLSRTAFVRDGSKPSQLYLSSTSESVISSDSLVDPCSSCQVTTLLMYASHYLNWPCFANTLAQYSNDTFCSAWVVKISAILAFFLAKSQGYTLISLLSLTAEINTLETTQRVYISWRNP